MQLENDNTNLNTLTRAEANGRSLRRKRETEKWEGKFHIIGLSSFGERVARSKLIRSLVRLSRWSRYRKMLETDASRRDNSVLLTA